MALPDEAGQLARVSREFANRGINIQTMCAIGRAAPNVAIVTEQIIETRMMLDEMEIPYTVSELLTLVMPDRPGSLADFAERLGNSGVNITSIYVLSRYRGDTELAFSVDDMEKARATLNLHESVPP
ncbi:MAG: ACT domain-containing protein [Candidatus Thermoplasmatota archaeon]|nr:ACT domain-containing protein [Candidatus Thalassarchaeum sp.]MEE3310075.1 ACT domain-containing protein [Candidatus Thermoplasmatota archaeon]